MSLKTNRTWLIAGALGVTVAVVAAVLVLSTGPAKAREFATLHILSGRVEFAPSMEGSFRPATDGYVPNHAERAIKAALTMQEYMEAAKEKADERGLRVPGVGVGVSTGAAVVGNIGSQERLDYTVIGDTVNTASRICGVAEAGEVVVNEECAAAVGELFPIAPLPPLKVKGKRDLLKIFQVLRPGQEAKAFQKGATTEAHDEASFEDQGAPPEDGQKEPATVEAAGYAPIEPPREER